MPRVKFCYSVSDKGRADATPGAFLLQAATTKSPVSSRAFRAWCHLKATARQAVGDDPPRRQVDVAKACRLDPAALYRAIGELERAGMLTISKLPGPEPGSVIFLLAMVDSPGATT